MLQGALINVARVLQPVVALQRFGEGKRGPDPPRVQFKGVFQGLDFPVRVAPPLMHCGKFQPDERQVRESFGRLLCQLPRFLKLAEVS